MTEMVVLVDEHDQQIGVAEKMQAHEQGLLHRAFSVFIVRMRENTLEILLQQRKSDKYHCGSLWTNTCCSHPRVGEDIVTAAQRRLFEEMGLQISLQPLNAFIYRAPFANGLVEYEYDHVLYGLYNDELIIANPDEVQDYAWMSIYDLQDRLEQEPELYTPWLQPALQILQGNMSNII